MTTERPRVLVLMGGPDAEREVSLDGGREVAAALRAHGRGDIVDAVVDRPTAADITAFEADVVFPVLHGPWGEGGALQEVLEAAGVAYVGSRPGPSRRAMDKLVTKMLLAPHEIPTPPARELVAGVECDLAPPLVLKPVDDGSSVDLCICRTDAEVREGVRRLQIRRPRLMAERLIEGREVTVGIVLDEPLPPIEVAPAEGLYDYAAKYEREDTGYIVDAELPPGVSARCVENAMIAYRALGCRDLARVDFMVDERGPWFLEINTIPGFTTHSLVPMAARHAGVPMPELCWRLVEHAWRRGADRPTTARHDAATATRDRF